jgi:hypothetical protein
VSYFLKQLGSHVLQNDVLARFDNSHAGDWSEWPQELRVREVPGMANTERTDQQATPTKTKTPAELSASAKKAWETRRRNASAESRSVHVGGEATATVVPCVDLERLQKAKEFVLACGGIENAIAAIEGLKRLQIGG